MPFKKKFIFLGSWMPLSVVNILRDMGVGFLDVQMYFKLLTVHALAMTTICTNPLLYFWMSKVIYFFLLYLAKKNF